MTLSTFRRAVSVALALSLATAAVELLALRCCYPSFRDGGSCPGEVDCSQVEPAELVGIGGDDEGPDCVMGGDWRCSAWVRDGGVLVTWTFCQD